MWRIQGGKGAISPPSMTPHDQGIQNNGCILNTIKPNKYR